MVTPSADRRARHRGRRVATAVSALAAGASLAGATAGLADAAAGPHTASSKTDRALSIVTTHNGSKASRTSELQYFTAHNRYLLADQYADNKLSDISWQKDDLDAGHRFVDRVVLNPPHKTWFEQTQTVPPLPPHSLGIRSTTKEVARAIQGGKAHPFGLTRKDGQRVRLLLLVPSSKDQGSTLLWVNSSTDRPVSETETFTVGRVRHRTVRSNWENVSPSALDRLRAKPKIPVGYKVTRP